MSSGIANANPDANPQVERFGSDSDGSADGAARSFTEFLENEDDGASERRRSNPKAQRREAPRQTDGAEGDEGQPPKRQPPKRERQEAQDDNDDADDPLHDPILDNRPDPKRKGQEDEDGEDGDNDADDGDDDTDEGDDGDEGDEDDDPEHEVTIRGVPTKVKQSELVQGYLREADYRQKTTALSQDRQVVEQAYGVANQRVETLDAVIQTYQDLINAVMPSQQEWEALKAKDPNAYIQAQEQWGGFLGKMEQAKAHREALAGTKTQEESRRNSEYMRAENAKLLERLPQLQDQKIARSFANTIFGYGKKMGYSEDEMKAGLVNHRDVMTAYYAARYLELQESRQANRKQANKAKPRQSEGTSQPRTPQTRQGRRISANRSEQRRADRELQRTGSQASAAAAFSAMFRE